MSSEHEPDRHEQIVEQLRARATWQTQPTLVPGAPESETSDRPGGSQTWVYVAVASAAVLLLLVLFFSASGMTGGGAAVSPGGGSSGTVSASALTPEAAAETAGRFWLSIMAGDYDAFEGLVDPNQRPVSQELRQQFAEIQEQWQWSQPSVSMGWQGEAFVVEFVESGPDSYSSALRAVPDWGNDGGYFVQVHLSDGDYEEAAEFFLVPHGDSWVIQTIDGQELWELFGY